MAQIFKDGFESNDFSAWDADGASVATKSTTGVDPLTGTYSAEFDVDKTDGDSSFYANVHDDFTAPASDKLYLKAQVNFSDMTSAGYEIKGSKAIMMLLNGGTKVAWLIIGNNGGNPELQLAYRKVDGTTGVVGSKITLTSGVTYRVKLKYDWSGADPVVAWYLNEVEQASETDTSEGAVSEPQDAEFGIIHNVNWEKGNYTFKLDECGVYDDDPDAGATPKEVTDSGSGADAVSVKAQVGIAESGQGAETPKVLGKSKLQEAGSGVDIVGVKNQIKVEEKSLSKKYF